MRSALLGSVSAVLAASAAAWAQAPAPVLTQASPPAAAAQPADMAQPADTLPAPEATAAPDGAEPRYVGPPLPPPGRFYVDGEFLLWFSKPNKLPPLVTTGRINDVSSTAAVGEPGTNIAFGNQPIDGQTRVGGRLRAGAWLNAEETCGIEVGGFYVEPNGTHGAASSDGSLPLGIPFANAEQVFTTPETSLLLAHPGFSSGSVSVATRNTVWGAEAQARVNLAGGPHYRADLLAGARYLRLTDDLLENSTLSALPTGFVTFPNPAPPPPVAAFLPPATVAIVDHFHTRNEFYGGQIGGLVEVRQGVWFADFRGTLALGPMHQVQTIEGSSTLLVPGMPTTTVPGGVFAQATNIGRHSRYEFGVVPEAGVTLGCQVTSFLRATVGYSALYFRNDVIRTGTALNRQVSQSLIPTLFNSTLTTQTQPAVLFNNVDYWAQGVNFGIEVDF
jgi:hypothetical protein